MQDRKWSVHRGVYEDGSPEPEEEFRARVRAKMMDCEATGDLIGGGFYWRPQRQEVEPGVWVTTAWHLMWVTEGAARRATGEFDREPVPVQETEANRRVQEMAAVGAEDEGADS